MGDQAFEMENYGSAAYFYSKVLNNSKNKIGNITHPYEVKAWSGTKSNKKDTTDNAHFAKNPYVVNQLAESYRLNHEYDKAEEWYKIAINYPSEQHPDVKFWYADALIKNAKYDEAITKLEAIKKDTSLLDGIKKRANNALMGCLFAKSPSSTHTEANFKKADSTFNASNSSFGTSFYGNEITILFSSSGRNNTISDPKNQDANYLSDFYYVAQNIDNEFENPSNIGTPINSDQIEGGGALSIDRTTFYFTRQNPMNPRETKIWVSKFFNNQWMHPLQLNDKVNQEGVKSMHPALSMEGDVLYFSSDRPGGYGGMDIWYCYIDEMGNLSDPINMGPNINTVGNEVTPFYHYFSKTLYYSSDGLKGIGGLDIYRTTHDEDNDIWSMPVNIGRPYNSEKDDAFFIMNKEQKLGFLSSDREKCNCGEENEGTDYCYQIYTFTKPEMKYSISGVVYNAETDEVIPNALVTFKDVRGNMDPFFITTDENGAYSRDLEINWELFIKAQKKNFFGDAASISTLGLTESKHFIQDFFLTPIPGGEIEIPGIEYDFDKATLRPKSKEILDSLVSFLELNENITIEIRSHTDARGNDAYNQRLSEARAQSVVKYLVSKGIDKNRLVAVGMGETEPIYTMEQINKMPTKAEQEEAHQRNRRTAFKTLSQDFNDVFKGNK